MNLFRGQLACLTSVLTRCLLSPKILALENKTSRLSAQWPKAEAEFRAECKLRPGNAEAAYRLGVALLQQGKSHDAHVELKRSNELKPDMPETLYSLGKAAALDGDSAAAEKSWLKVLELEKDTSLAAQSHFGLAGLYRKQGKTAQAQHEMQEFQKLQSTIGPPRSE